MRTVTCTTDGCENAGHPIEVPDAPAEGDVVICGPCGGVLDNTTGVELSSQAQA